MALPGRLARRVAVSAGVLIIGTAALEMAVGWCHPETTRAALTGTIEERLQPWSRPDAEFHHVGDGIFRLRFPAPDDIGSPRVLLVGDSFTMGHGVGEEARFGSILQRRLGGGSRVDVLAASSYSPVIYRRIVSRALGLAPYRAVAVFVDQSDPIDDLIYQDDLLAGNTQGLFDAARMERRAAFVRRGYLSLLGRYGGWANPRRLAIVNFLSPIAEISAFDPSSEFFPYLERALVRRRQLRIDFASSANTPETHKMRELLTGHLDEIVTLCRRNRAELYLVANPWEYQVTTPRPGFEIGFSTPFPWENRLEALLRERYGHLPAVHVLPLTEEFRRHEDPSSLFLSKPREIHWSRLGHRLVAGFLEQHLRGTENEIAGSKPQL